MNTNFNYTSPEGLTLNPSTEALMLAVDNFHYDVLNPDFSSFGEIHNTLDIRLVSQSDIKKRTIYVKLGDLRERLNKMLTRNQQIRKQYEETRVESILAGLCDTSYFEDIVNQHAGKDDTVVVAIETFQERLGYYKREKGRGLIVLVKKRNENQMVATLIHEYIHAWADKEATGDMNDAEYAEEEIAEYGMLHFLQAIAGSDNQFHQILLDAINDVENKKRTLGLVHYGFGAELYYNYAHINWERLLRDAHTLVGTGIKEYDELKNLLQTYPEKNNLNKVANLLYDVLLTQKSSYKVVYSGLVSNNGENTNSSNCPHQISPQRNALAPKTSQYGKLIGHFIVAGLISCGGANNLKSLKINSVLSAEHELNNPYDENAVRLLRPDGRLLGYVPMYKENAPRKLFEYRSSMPLFSATVAYMLDNKLPLAFVVSNLDATVEYRERWVEIEVYGF